MAMTGQRLVVLFDGTWNDHHKETNVYRMARSIRDFDGDTQQSFFYDPGVGTSKFERLPGGLFGYGLSRNLQEGYDWLARRYREGDEIYVFGFSRGAYTARSLVGMIRKCGLIHIVTPTLLREAEKLYRSDFHPNDDPCRKFRDHFSAEVKVRMIGVWDTVGALGIPHTSFSVSGKYRFHDTQLSGIVENAYQALALDEHRAAYDAVLWTGEEKPGQKVEQLWFVGAHANVGGGYPDDPLARVSFAWMQEKAEGAGLKLRREPVPPDAYLAKLRDPFAEMFHGGYALASRIFRKGDGRHYRNFGRNAQNSVEEDGNPNELAIGVGIHQSVIDRMTVEPSYRPPTLMNAGMLPGVIETK